MKKRILSAILAAAVMLSTTPVGIAESAVESNLLTDVNQDITTSTGVSLLDDTYQYCVENDEYFAYMWVPQEAQYLNGVMIAKSNLIEARLMQSKTVRDVLAKYNIGLVYLHTRNTTEKPETNSVMGSFDYRDDNAAGSVVDEMMARFAAVSGYDELRYTPFIGVGHSAAMGLGHSLGSWDPSRAIAQICLKGGTALTISGVSGSDYVGDNYDVQPGVPTFLETGQFTEHASYDNPSGKDNYIDGDLPNLTKIRAKGTDRLVTMSVEWEAGHYDWSEKSNEIMADYLDAVIPARLGAQATAETKMDEDYELVDLTQTGYVSGIEMFGTRTSHNADDSYSHGEVSEFTEDEQKGMAWFPNEAVYNSMRNFTADRKDIPSEVDNNSYVTYDISYTNDGGNFSEWPSGNICYYVSNTQSIAMEFDITTLKNADSVVLNVPFKAGNATRAITVSTISNPWSEDRVFTVPADETVIAESISASTLEVDVTDAVKAESGDKIYIRLSSTEEGSGSDFYCTTEYTGYTCGSLTTDKANLPRLEPVSGDAVKTTKHQYLQIEDPTSKIPKAFTRITRYDAVNPNDSLYADGLENDPMSFSMYVDKMNVVSPDHIDAGDKVAAVSDTPAVVTPVMAPVEWVGVEKVELNDTDAENNVATKWRNVLRWKNNRLYYRLSSQDSYMNLNTFDVYGDDEELDFAYATNTFMLYPLYVSGGQAQQLTMPEVADVASDFVSFDVNPTSSASLPVDLIVEYGPVKAQRNADGSYTITPEQIPSGASYPIECKLVATQFGVNNNGTKINTAQPVEQVFYITEDSEISALPLNGEINQNVLIEKGVTGFNVEGSGTITLKMNNNTVFDAERAAAITAQRTSTVDTNYSKHYTYPAEYNPYDYWSDYPGEWTAEVTESGFVPLSAFTNGDRKNINLRYLNTIVSEGVTSITPVIAQTEVTNAKANPWGDGVNIVWQKPQGSAYDSVKVYVKSGEGEFALAENVTYGKTNALVTGLEDGEYSFKITTVKDDVESDGATISGTVSKMKYLLEDFETGDLTSGMNWLDGQETPSAYAWFTYTGASVMLSADENDNHYMGIQNTYTSAIQTMNINIPGGLTPEMTKLIVDIKVDKLENSQSSGQVYFELFNPATGKSYGIEKGDDFALEDKEWHNDYSINLSSFGLPTDEETLSQITVLKIGRKVVGGGNNNRRGKIYLDNLGFEETEPLKTSKVILSADNIAGDNSALPNGFEPDTMQVNYLFDGDTTNTNLYSAGKQKRLYFDLGAEYPIAKIVVTDYTTKGTLMVSGSTIDPSTVSTHDEAFKTMLRTNGSTQNGVASTYEDIMDGETAIGRTAVANDVYLVSGFEKVRYISIYDWSNAPQVAEVEIYVVDDDSYTQPTPGPTTEPTPTAEPTPAPTYEPMPAGAVNILDLVSNNTSKRTITMNEAGAVKDVAASNANNHIYYIGDYDISQIEKIETRLSFAERQTSETETSPAQVKFAYMDIADEETVDETYLNDNSSTIRSSAKIVAAISGKTTYTVEEANKAEDYIGAVYTVDASGVTVDADSYAIYPGGTATVEDDSVALSTSVTGKKHLFIYATASKGRAVMDYVNITMKKDETIPEGALSVLDLVSNNTSSRTITMNNEGDKKTVASSNADNYIYYVGDYDISQIEKIETRLSLAERQTSEEETSPAQVKFAYMDIAEGDVIDETYLNDNSSTIRSTAKRVGTISGTTTYMVEDADQAQDYIGAVYTIDESGVTVDADSYAVYPGGIATVEDGSEALSTSVTGKKHLFIYATASKGRAVMDYVNITMKKDETIPEGGLSVLELTSNNTGTRVITMNSNGDKKTVAASNGDTHIYYIGDYDISEIDNIETRLSFVERATSETETSPAQVKFAYMDIAEGTVVDETYLNDNSGTIRSAAKRVGTISGKTTYMVEDTDKAQDYFGAVYTIDADGVTVDAEAYAVYPGGVATVEADSEGLLASVTGEKHLFMYATASKGRAVMDYVKVNLKGAEPTIQPTTVPTVEPTVEPTTEPTSVPTVEPTSAPTTAPTATPTTQPTTAPTIEPTVEPTTKPVTGMEFGAPVKTETGITIPVAVGENVNCDAVIYVAEYTDNVLTAIRAVYEKNITVTEDIQIPCSITEGTDIKIFIWDKEMKPLWNVLKFE